MSNIQRARNGNIDALATLASKGDVLSEVIDVSDIRKILGATVRPDSRCYYQRARLVRPYHLESYAAICNHDLEGIKGLYDR